MDTRYQLGPAREVPDQDYKVYQLDAMDVMVCKIDGRYYAISTFCPHAGANLGRGQLDHNVITCPGHGLRFDVTSGHCLDRPELTLTSFKLEVDGEYLYILF